MGDQNNHGPLLAFLLAVIALCMAGLMAWFMSHTQISAGILAWKHTELQWVGRFTTYYVPLDQRVVDTNPASLTLPQVVRLFDRVGRTVDFWAAAILLLAGLATFFIAPSNYYRKKLDLDTLVTAQPDRYRFASAFLGRNPPMEAPAESAPRNTDFALHDEEWIRRFAMERGKYQDHAARRAFADQLGPSWGGDQQTAGHVRCLFATFALHANRQREAAIEYMGDLAEAIQKCPADEAPALSGKVIAEADRILSDPAVVSSCREVASRHAYQTTAMMSVLAHARKEAGVLAPAQFNWLKLIDRNLWYALHHVGMPNALIEARGARAHWDAEIAVCGPLHAPQIDAAVLSIRARARDAEKTI